MTDRELMQQALEALVWEAEGWEDVPPITRDAITALRAALAEPEQEPVAWISESENLLSWDKFYDHMTPLYTVPRQWQGLTDEEIIDVLHPLVMADLSDEATDYEIARAIEAKLKKKNT